MILWVCFGLVIIKETLFDGDVEEDPLARTPCLKVSSRRLADLRLRSVSSLARMTATTVMRSVATC